MIKRLASPDSAHRVLHDLGPVTHQHQPQRRTEHYHQERPVELPCTADLSVISYHQLPTVQSPSDGVESKHDEDHHVCDEVGEHLEPQESVDLLAGVVEVAVDASQYIKLNHDGGFLITRNLRLVSLKV